MKTAVLGSLRFSSKPWDSTSAGPALPSRPSAGASLQPKPKTVRPAETLRVGVELGTKHGPSEGSLQVKRPGLPSSNERTN